MNIVKSLLNKEDSYYSIMINYSNNTRITYDPKSKTSLFNHWDSNQGVFCLKCSIDK